MIQPVKATALIAAVAVMLGAGTLPNTAAAQSAGQGNLEDAKAMINQGTRELIDSELAMSRQESEAFWEVYERFDTEMDLLGDQYLRLLEMYMDRYLRGVMTDSEAVRLIEWGFRAFETVPLFEAGVEIEQAEVWMGTSGQVPLVVEEDLVITLARGVRDDLRVVARIEEPVPAPIATGDRIATLVISAPGMPDREVPLLAGADVERRGFVGRVVGALGHYTLGWIN